MILRLLLSLWKEGEQPDREQVEELVDIFLEEMGILIDWPPFCRFCGDIVRIADRRHLAG